MCNEKNTSIQLFDSVKLKSGETAFIVEILGNGKSFVADIEKADGTDTEFITFEQIESIIE
jgi:hypothetical protein